MSCKRVHLVLLALEDAVTSFSLDNCVYFRHAKSPKRHQIGIYTVSPKTRH